MQGFSTALQPPETMLIEFVAASSIDVAQNRQQDIFDLRV